MQGTNFWLLPGSVALRPTIVHGSDLSGNLISIQSFSKFSAKKRLYT